MDRLSWAAAVLVVLTLAGVLGKTASDRASLTAARAAWIEHGERPPAPTAVSGGTRAFQDAH